MAAMMVDVSVPMFTAWCEQRSVSVSDWQRMDGLEEVLFSVFNAARESGATDMSEEECRKRAMELSELIKIRGELGEKFGAIGFVRSKYTSQVAFFRKADPEGVVEAFRRGIGETAFEHLEAHLQRNYENLHDVVVAKYFPIHQSISDFFHAETLYEALRNVYIFPPARVRAVVGDWRSSGSFASKSWPARLGIDADESQRMLVEADRRRYAKYLTGSGSA